MLDDYYTYVSPIRTEFLSKGSVGDFKSQGLIILEQKFRQIFLITLWVLAASCQMGEKHQNYSGWKSFLLSPIHKAPFIFFGHQGIRTQNQPHCTKSYKEKKKNNQQLFWKWRHSVQPVMGIRLLSYEEGLTWWTLLHTQSNCLPKELPQMKKPPLRMFPQTKGTNSTKHRQLLTPEDGKRSEAKEATARSSGSVRERCWRSSSNAGVGTTKPHFSYTTVQRVYT